MGEIKPVGSEKLKGDAKLKRILELTYFNASGESTKPSDVIKESSSGVYGIVKEKDGYYVKRGLNENSLDYIGGMFMKNKNRCSSYGEALKKLEFLTEQEKLQEATKYVLKRPAPAVPAPQAEAPAPMPTNEPPAPAAAPDPTAMDTADPGVAPGPEDSLGGEEDAEGAPEDPVKIIQTKTGRLTQKLNQYKDELESEDIKYVLGMVLAAVDLDKMEETDKDEILAKLEGDEGSEEGSPEMGSSVPEAGGEEGGMGSGETGGIDPINSLEELINEPFGDDDFTPYDPDEDEEEIYDIGPEDYKASEAARQDISRDRQGMDDDPVDDEVEYGGTDAEDEEIDELIRFYDDEGKALDSPVSDRMKPIDSDVNNAHGEPSDDQEIDELIRFYDDDGKALDSPVSDRMKPIDSDVNNVHDEPSDDVKEIDLDELTTMINGGVKETLSKYFN